MHFRGMPVLVLMFVCLTAGCTKDVSTNYQTAWEDNAVQWPEKESVSSRSDIPVYAMKIKEAIERNIDNRKQYSGKECTVRIIMERDGSLSGVDVEKGGDKDLCSAVLKALKKTVLPPPPSSEVYNVFKRAVLDFRP